jgi:EAL domain-containing protein (putative c-di-GMP-specific phosphodiesterase class I)
MPRRFGRVIVLSSRRARRGAGHDPALEALPGGRTPGVCYQPILARRVGADGVGRWRIEGAGALLRAGGDASMLHPAQFPAAAARAGLMPPLFQFVLAAALAALLEWQRDFGLALGVGVSLDTAALLDDTLPQLLEGLLVAADVAPSRVTLELAGSEPITDPGRAAANLERLRRAGLRAALGDFGAGSLTATRLAALECDELKIDPALVQGFEHCDERCVLVESLIELAHGRGMSACAEGVETHAALRLLGAFGCDRVQGPVVARPAPAAAFIEGVREWEARALFTGAAENPQLPLPGSGSSDGAGNLDARA